MTTNNNSESIDFQTLKAELQQDVAQNLRGYTQFYDELIKTTEPGWPTWSQSIRMKALLDRKRVGNFDDTGVNGKTFTFVGSKLCLDRETRKRNTALVVAPNNGLENAWHSDEINRYAEIMRMPEQKVITLRDYKSIDTISEDTDFAIINWEKLSVEEDSKRFGQVTDALLYLQPEIFGFDESHNAKGSTSLRARRIRDIVAHTLDGTAYIKRGGYTFKLKIDSQKGLEYRRLRTSEQNDIDPLSVLNDDRVFLGEKTIARDEALSEYFGSTDIREIAIEVLEHGKAGYKHLMLLSATPIPNRYRDLAMVFHMLDPWKYPSPSIFSYLPHDSMKEFLNEQTWFRLTRNDLKEELRLPDFHERKISVTLTDEEAEIYFKEWADCVTLGEGLTSLEKVLYNPRLSKYGSDFHGRGSKLEKIAALTEEIDSMGEKAIIKSNLVNFGIIENIVETLSRNKKVLVATGNNCLEYENGKLKNRLANTQDNKNALYRKWKHDPDNNILLISSIGEESVDLTTGTIPLHLIPFEPEITPREFNQFSGRGYRKHQKADVHHYTLITESPLLDRLMLEYLNELSGEYGIKVPDKFDPRTIDKDKYGMRIAKQDTAEKIYACEKISKNEQSVHDADTIDRAITHMQGLVAPRNFREIGDFELASLTQAQWRNLGEDQFVDILVKSKGWRKWRNLYESQWRKSASYETNRMIGEVIDALEEQGNTLDNIVSIGDGRAYFSRATKRPSLGIDVDEKWLEQGKRDCDKRKILYEYKVARATETELEKNVADAVVNAYCLMYLKQDQNGKEIEQAMLEANRVMRKGGYSVIALPYTMKIPRLRQWSENLQPYGFKEVAHYTPNQTKTTIMKKGVHILVHEKTKQNRKQHGKDLSFYDKQRRVIG